MSRISGSSYASKLMGRAGDGSTLSLDFTAMGGTIDSRITFSRADATARATFINSLGYVETVTAAQAPRFDFDPTTLAAKGLLLEAPATNLIYYSQNADPANSPYSVYWFVGAGATVSSTTETDPSNLSSASRCVLGTSGLGRVYNSQTTSNGVTYTFSFYAKSISGTTALHIWHFQSPTGGGYTAQTITTAWKRYSVTILGRVGGGFVEFGIANLTTSAATVDIWGLQLETGSQASSYIKTPAAATVTRAADTAIIAAGSNFSSWYTGGTTGTFVSNWYGSASTATARSVIATSDLLTKHLHMFQTASALTLRLADFQPGSTVTTSNSLTAGALTKGAFSYASTATSLCLNGGTVATGTLAFTVAPTWLSIGGPSTNGTSITDTTVMLNNSIRTLKYFPARLTDGQIQGLTT